MANTKTAKLVWEGNGLAFTVTGGSGYTIRFDNPSGPTGASPMEIVAMASGGCTASDVIDILRKKKQDVTGFEVNVLGARAAEHPMVFTEIDLEFVVRGRNIDPKAVERSIELSLSKYCSVNKMLEKAAKINSRYRIIEEAQPQPVAA
ncbi:MAG: osmotically inducible protein OsmC [Chloroflexi bacterium]|nr:osmotically inducible protein OsmC [Chloroflexota bacterium]